MASRPVSSATSSSVPSNTSGWAAPSPRRPLACWSPGPPPPRPLTALPGPPNAHGVPAGCEVSAALPRGVGVRGAVTLLLAPRCPKGDPSHPCVVLMAFPCAPKRPPCSQDPPHDPWSPLCCPHSPHAPRGPLLTPVLSPRPSPCPKGAPNHPCLVPHSSLAPQREPWITGSHASHAPARGGGGAARCPLPTRCHPFLPPRDFLARHTMTPRFIPAVHPGEPVFCAHPAPVPTLDTRGLKPQSVLEGFFLCNSPACQAAFVRDGGLSLLYRCVPTCPLPVLRWLFQALWEIWLSAGGECGAGVGLPGRGVPPQPPARPHRPPSPPGEPWCPTVREISGAFTRLGFLALCVVTQPSRYPDGARLALVTLLCFLGLDRALRCHPLPELQHLLHCLLEGIRDWQGQLPALCLSLCQLSGHHHNLVALVRLLPDLTKRDRRRWVHPDGTVTVPLAPTVGTGTTLNPPISPQLEVLGRLLALARPDALRRLVATGGQEKPEDLDQEACYLSYSLLLLASNVVGTENPPPKQRVSTGAWWEGHGSRRVSTVSLTPSWLSPQGYLERLCGQLDQHFGRGLQESPYLLFRSQLKSLAALLFVKWQEITPSMPVAPHLSPWHPNCPRGTLTLPVTP
uniref:Coiled-coil SMC6 And NSE5 INteracting (CANIN) domain-containing protein n=1 Tax=Calidris pygmaea TaxID=425635 RepID=A0A8C3JZN8_9CHAR